MVLARPARAASHGAGWVCGGFACPPSTTVAELAARLPEAVRRDLIEPLCVAALNTPTEAASGSVFLHVLRDALAPAPARPICSCRVAAWRPAAVAGAVSPGSRRHDDPARASGRGDRPRDGGRSSLAGRWRALRRRCGRGQRGRGGPLGGSARPGWAARAAALATSRSSRSTPRAPAPACPSRCCCCRPTTSVQRSSCSTAAGSVAPQACSPSSSAGPAPGSPAGSPPRRRRRWPRRAKRSLHPGRAARGGAHDRRKACHLPLHAHARSSAPGRHRGSRRGRRLRRGPLSRHPRGRGAQRNGGGTFPCFPA